MTKAEQAAREYAEKRFELFGSFTDQEEPFLKGIEWCRENELKIAVEALEKLAEPTGQTKVKEIDYLNKSITLGDIEFVYDERAEIAKAALNKIAMK